MAKLAIATTRSWCVHATGVDRGVEHRMAGRSCLIRLVDSDVRAQDPSPWPPELVSAPVRTEAPFGVETRVFSRHRTPGDQLDVVLRGDATAVGG